MVSNNDAWECECGHVVYGSYPPEECVKCWQTNSFAQAGQIDEEDEW